MHSSTQSIVPQIPLMPAAITSPSTAKSLKTKEKAPNGHSRPKKTRITRRRGRAKDGIHSDDEIEREARSDSDTDDDSSVVSSDSDAESDSEEDNHATRSEVVTPTTTQSPPPLHASASKAAPLENGAAGPFIATTDWAQMVADENANGATDLPVIDFADLNGHAISHSVAPEPRSRKQKASKKAPQSHNVEPSQPHVASESNEEPRIDDDQPAGAINDTVPSTSRPPSREGRPSLRSKGQTSRQAYQQRLESDPSFVPKVGEFWGHDDRLLDKDLRSLSGWWRGRWQSRGRGRVFPPRGRGGRGGFFGGRPPPTEGDDAVGVIAAPADQEIPPIERTWTHDGFEEMKKKEERRRADFQQRADSERRERSESRHQQGSPHPSNSSQRGFPFRGRGGFAGRGGFIRGGGVASPRGRPFVLPPGRVWYTMKPEKPFTQQHDSFLYFDPALKPRPGQGPGLRIKLPGGNPQVIRAPPKTHSAKPSIADTDTASVGASSERSDRVFTVRIPRPQAKGVEAAAKEPIVDEADKVSKPTAEELSLEEVFTVRPHAGPQHVPIEISQSVEGDKKPVVITQHRPSFSRSHSRSISFLPDLETQQQLETIVVKPPVESSDVSATIEETVLRNPQPTSEVEEAVIEAPEPDFRPAPPSLPPIQTSFSPVPQASPPFNGSPYPYAPPLPPGVAMSHHGYPYEVATGRPVYLHQPTPPPVMYDPRPMMHGHMHHPSNGGVPFVPGHMHHPSSISSPEFLPQPHTPPVNSFIDPSSGVPIFTPARQSSRVEIRAPDGKGLSIKHQPRPSGLRTSVVESDDLQGEDEQEPSYIAQHSEANGEATDAEPRQEQEGELIQATSPPPMMPYNPYAQPYYYPEQYGYNPYLPQPPVMQYEMYPADHHHHRGQSQPILYY
ncbi:hypothetical protein QCA50_020130 [Cerrena zonata]|uniref:Btz domain-containing protein n=1 Tax=Cerrena zonata TaxID=2478898 RepID=A0AAW0FCA4_9APHY